MKNTKFHNKLKSKQKSHFLNFHNAKKNSNKQILKQKKIKTNLSKKKTLNKNNKIKKFSNQKKIS